MKLMFPKNSCVGALSTFLFLCLMTTFGLAAQTKKAAVAKKPADKKSAVQAKDAKKKIDAKSKAPEPRSKTANQKKTPDKEKANAKNKGNDNKGNDNKEKRLTAKDRSKAEPKNKKDTAKVAESKKAAAEKRRIEAEKRAAALAERRRREQAAREARARQLAFERGLRTETLANIARDNTEGEDLAIRAEAIKALGSHAGSVVVMESQTGKVLTIVNQDWAIRDSVKPCSTIKLVTGVAGLNEGVISKEDGSIRNTSTRHDLDDALAHSDNPYFQRAGSIVGNDKMIEYARKMGLGEPTGMNTEGETAGKLALGNNNPRIYSHGDDFEVSTLQLAVMVSAITNGGLRVIPRVPRNEVEKAKFQTFYRQKIELPKQNLRRVIPGMMGAAEYGTARRGMDQSLGVAGKTGSCISKGSWVGLFASVAPIEDPKYSVVVITRGQSERGRHAAAVASKIYSFLSRQIVRTDRNLAQTEFKLPPRFPVPATTASAVVEEEEDDNDGAENRADLAVTGSADDRAGDTKDVADVKQVPVVRQDAKKLVTKTGNSKPVFPPVVITYDKEIKETDTKKGTKP
jgi:penicillin-binding protein 2